jgi:hypothetical protein|tara:strand:- start:145 stop:348 length:204 start_codon:yes stop_codon:yes gene_type:complete
MRYRPIVDLLTRKADLSVLTYIQPSVAVVVAVVAAVIVAVVVAGGFSGLCCGIIILSFDTSNALFET